MDQDMLAKLSALAKELWEVDQTIRRNETKHGEPDRASRTRFIELDSKIGRLLAEEPVLDDMRDLKVKDILRKVRDRDYFVIHKQMAQLQELIDKYGSEAVSAVLEQKGVNVTESEIDDYLTKMRAEFMDEMENNIDMLAYFDRKEKIGALISASKLPPKIHTYLDNIKNSYLDGQSYAVLGLCRVILEIAFKEKRATFTSKILYWDEYKFRVLAREVCERLDKKHLIEASCKVWIDASKVLHGDDPSFDANSDKEVLDFIHRAFSIIEQLYE